MAGRKRTGEARYRTMFQNSHHGILFFDKTDFTIWQINDAFSSLLHYQPGELNEKKFTSLFYNEEEKSRFLTLIGQHSETLGFETRFETKEGNECWVDLSWNALDGTTYSCMVTDINVRKISELAVNDELVHCHQLTQNSQISILIVKHRKILYANPAFSVFSGYLPKEITGNDFLTLVYAADQQEFKIFLIRISEENHKADRGEFRFMTKSGDKRMALLLTNPIIHAGEPATLVNLVDISDKQQLEDKIQLDNERRRGIIITVAHELRTPLQPILGYLNLLVQDPAGFGIPEPAKKILERCLVSVERERQIINQMLELSVLESGRLHISYSKFPLLTLVKSVLDTGGYVSKADIMLDIPDSLIITADMDRLFGVFDALLSNAVNFSKPPREISIFYRSGIDDTCHQISVRDNGAGISESAFSSIFEPFQLADAAQLSRRYDRIGLSLSIAKKIMQMHGGDITVASTLNAGSTFTLHLPKIVKNTLENTR
ncbi:MAG: PAS domain-containing sensor histidine kinase [Methanoregula sp.]|nr:PAS domain-containing sensor histidine kinase [Methanoregula sp.]